MEKTEAETRGGAAKTGAAKRDGFADLAAAFAKVYNIGNSQEVFDSGYEAQVRNPAFVGALTFNCMVMNGLYGCRRGGCAGCRARALFDGVTDAATRARIDMAMAAMDAVDAAEPPKGVAR